MNRNFTATQKLVKCLSGLNVHFYSEAQLVQEYLCREFQNIHLGNVLKQKILRLSKSFVPDCIYEVTTHFGCQYLVVYNQKNQVYLIAGPCFLKGFDAGKAIALLRQQGVCSEAEEQMTSFFQNLPVISYDRFHQLGTLLMQLLFDAQEQIPYRHVECTNFIADHDHVMLVDNYDEIAKMRRVEKRYELCAALTQAVKQGNLSLAYSYIQEMDVNNPDLQRASNHLRNMQNLCITTNTQLRHALEGSGIHPYYLDALSAEIAKKIEDLTCLEEAESFAKDIIRRYCNLSQDHIYPDLKPFSKLAVTYTKTHLSDNLTVKGVAKALMVTPDYLSTRFHQEVGLTFIDFLNRERINQAAALLKHTNLQIQQIAAAVGYNHTSYFAKQFAKYKNTSPRLFRQNGDFA